MWQTQQCVEEISHLKWSFTSSSPFQELLLTVSYRHMQKRQENQCFYLKHIDWDGNDNIEQVSQSQAANQDIGPVPHALVLVYDPEQRRVANDAHHKDQAGDDGVHVLEGVPDFCGLQAHRRGGASWPRWHLGWWWWRWCRSIVSGQFWNFSDGLGVTDGPGRCGIASQQQTQQNDGLHPPHWHQNPFAGTSSHQCSRKLTLTGCHAHFASHTLLGVGPKRLGLGRK